jgi:hypothetical protein
MFASKHRATKTPIPGKSVGSGSTPKAAPPPGGLGADPSAVFNHKAHQATSRGTFEVFQKQDQCFALRPVRFGFQCLNPGLELGGIRAALQLALPLAPS